MKLRSFRGGYRFTRFRGQPQDELHEAALPQSVYLRLGPGEAALVRTGQAVVAGDILARDDAGVSSPVVASISGTVDKLASGGIAIRGDGSRAWRALPGASPEWGGLPLERIEDLLYFSGASALGAGGIPTRFGSSVLAREDAVDVIVTAACGGEPFEPLIPAVIGASGAAAVLDGVAMLRRLMPRAGFHLAVSRSTRALFADDLPDWLSVSVLEDRYPALQESVLTRMLLARAVPAWRRAIDSGIVILDAQAVLQARAAVTEGKPLVERTVALAGPGFASPVHVRARIGAPIADVVRDRLAPGSPTVILGGALSGEPVKDLGSRFVARDTSLVVALEEPRPEMFGWTRVGLDRDSYSRTFLAGLLPLAKRSDTGLHGELRPCISCNFCDRVCPAQILPHLLHRYVRRNVIDETLVRYRIFDCIDCGLCTYVCPSKIPVAGLMADGKRRLREEGFAPPAAGVARDAGIAKEAKQA